MLGEVGMVWKVEYDDKLQIVVLTYSGKTKGEDIKEAAAARIAMGKEKGVTNYLIDTRKIATEGSSTFDIFTLPSKMYPDKRVESRSRIAVIIPELPTEREMVQFYEDVCFNRGWMVKTFQDHDSALKWLQQDPEPITS